MPRIYLSPSTQEFNFFVNGGTEEEYMNLVADALVPWLNSSGILYTRNTPDMTAASSIVQSNAGEYDLHFSIHSNAAPEGKSGTVRGSIAYHYPNVWNGTRIAGLIVANMKEVYPYPRLVKSLAVTNIGEVSKTRAPSVLWEVAYHDNLEDAQWIKDHIEEIAWVAARSITEYFGLPLVEPQPARQGRITMESGNLNIRSRPSLAGQVIARAANGATLTVLGQTGEWYVVRYGSVTGYAAGRYIQLT